MRIEDIDGRTRPADPRTHEGYQISSRDAPLPWGSGMLIIPRVLSRDLWVSAPALDPPHSDMLSGARMGAWARRSHGFPGICATRRPRT